MSSLSDVTFDDIYSKIMIVLMANEGQVYDQYKLYSLVLDKFTRNESSGFVSPEFKYKFLIVMRQLMSKDDSIKVFKTNNIYQVIYNAPPETELKPSCILYKDSWINNWELSGYIINNNIDFKYQDMESGNTIYHDVLSENNCENVKKLLENKQIDFTIKNNYNKTPLECINDIKVAAIIINDLHKKLTDLEEKIIKLERKNESFEMKIYKLEKSQMYLDNQLVGILFFLLGIGIYSLLRNLF